MTVAFTLPRSNAQLQRRSDSPRRQGKFRIAEIDRDARIPAASAIASSCAIVKPPAARIAAIPRAPSLPVGEHDTDIAYDVSLGEAVELALEPVEPRFKEPLFEANKPVKYVYFPGSFFAVLMRYA